MAEGYQGKEHRLAAGHAIQCPAAVVVVRRLFAGTVQTSFFVAQHRIDGGHDIIGELRDYFQRAEVLGDLFQTRRARDHGADVRVLDAPRECELRQGRAEIGGDLRQTGDLRQVALTPVSFQHRFEPFVTRQVHANVIGDAVRSIVDGHIVLSRNLSQRGHFPAVDVLQSSSRVMKSVSTEPQMRLAQKVRETLAVFKEAEDLINICAYKRGANPKIDQAVKLIDPLNDFLRQRVDDPTSITNCGRELQKIFSGVV